MRRVEHGRDDSTGEHIEDSEDEKVKEFHLSTPVPDTTITMKFHWFTFLMALIFLRTYIGDASFSFVRVLPDLFLHLLQRTVTPPFPSFLQTSAHPFSGDACI